MGWSVLLSTVLAQTGFAAERSQNPNDSLSGAWEQENFSHSLSLAIDRDLGRAFQALQRAIEQQEWALVSEHLLELQQTDQKTLVNVEGVISSVSSAAERMVNLLPPEGRETYLRLAEPRAQAKLQEALQHSSLDELQQVVRCYRQTAAAQQARIALSHWYRDLGDSFATDLLIQASETPQNKGNGLPGAVPQLVRPTEYSFSVHDQLLSDELSKHFPSQIPQWEYRLQLAPQVRQTLQRTYHELLQSGLSPYPIMRLKAAGDSLIYSGPTGRVSLDPKSGTVNWEHSTPGYVAAWIRNPGSLGDANRRRLFAMSVARRVFGETVTTETTVDGDRLYAVEDIRNNVGEPASADEFSPFPTNRILCLSADQGTELWQFTGESSEKYFFSGPPVRYGDRLLVMAEAQSSRSIVLITLDRKTGEQIDAFPFAFPLLSLAEDAPRQARAARIVSLDGKIICVTAAGLVVAVDPILREVSWARRLPRTDIQTRPSEADDLDLHQSGFEVWDSWQQIQILPASSTLLVATPESGFLHALERRTGRLLWSTHRQRAACLATADERHGVVLIEKTQARALDLKTGKTKWATHIPQPAGRGVLAGESYLFPVLEQETARLNLATGATEISHHSNVQLMDSESPLCFRIRPRNLVQCRDELFEVSTAGVRKLQSPRQALVASSFASRWEEALNTIERGEWRAAAEHLDNLLQQPLNDQSHPVRRTLLSLLSNAFRSSVSPVEQNQLSARLDALATTPFERAVWRQLKFRNAIQNRDWPAVVTLWLNTPQEELFVLLPSLDEDLRCRFDRCLQSEILQVEANLPDDEAAKLNQLIEDELPDPLSLSWEERQRLQYCLGNTHWGIRFLLKSPMDSPSLADRIQFQLRCLEIVDHPLPELAAGAMARLMQTSLTQSQWLDAVRWKQRLETFPSKLRLPDQQTVADVLEQFKTSFDVNGAADLESSPWPNLHPQVEVKSRRTSEVYLHPLMPRTHSGGLLDRISVELDIPGRRALRFNGSRWNRPWYLRLPTSTRNLHHESGASHIWGIEQMCVLQSGSELFGIAPLDSKGGRSSSLLWPPEGQTIDTLGSRENLMLSFQRESIPQRPGFEQPAYRLLDEFSHFAKAVGPVRPGYFCIQQLGMLVAFETATGRELWRRYDLPKTAHCFGDDQHLAVISPSTRTLTIYRSSDGHALEQRAWTRPAEDFVQADGMQILLARGDRRDGIFDLPPEEEGSHQSSDDHAVMEQLDLLTERVIWKQEFPRGAIPFEMDREFLGVLQPDGQLEILERKTGRAICHHQLEVPEKTDRILCSPGEQDWLIVISPVEDNRYLEGPARWQAGERRPIVSGQAICIDRQSHELLWTRKLPTCVFPIDQPRDLPVFVTVGSLQPPASSPDPDEKEPGNPDFDTVAVPDGGTLWCYDRRNGQLLKELRDEKELFYSIIGHRQRQEVRIHTTRSRIEIDFSRVVEEPAGSTDAGEPDSSQSDH